MMRRAIARALTAALLAAMVAPAEALASASDQAATRTYLQADSRLVATVASRIPRIEAVLRSVLKALRGECPKAAAGSPQDPQSTQLSDEVIGAMITAVVALDRPAGHSFVAATQHLHWSNRALTREIQSYVGKVRTLTALPQPHLCADVRAWAANGFKTLPASTVSFAPLFMSVWVAAGELPAALSSTETSSERPLIVRTQHLETELTELEAREVETYWKIMNVLGLWP
jgi:hypothetical protein